MKVILDTNVLVSGIFFKGPPLFIIKSIAIFLQVIDI
jgi:predicted nucleic acid-binding protein